MKFADLLKGKSEEFLNPKYEHLHDPFLLPDMDKAVERILKAMKNDEHIMVFSDYDADGIPGAVVANDFFRRAKYENVSFYIPHRHNEGFGLSEEAIDEAASRKAKLLITIDCGSADPNEVRYANKKEIDVIITDHHECGDLPPAHAIVNPKRKDSTYPFKELCGSGVIYKVVQAVLSRERFGIPEGHEKWSLDMVAIATLSDLVPLVGENRVLAKFGLEQVLRKSPRPGIQALCRKLGMDQRYLSEDDIAFMITPRINAASRMGVPEDAFKLLSTASPIEAERLAAHLESINNERKGVVASLVKDAKKYLSQREDLPAVIVIGNPEWRPSLLGLVANSLVEEYSRPAFVWGRDGDGVLKGSCRSYNGYDLFELMSSIPENFLEFGGHAGAGGFSVTLEQLQTLESALSAGLDKLAMKKAEEEKGIELALSDIGEELWQTLSRLAPFGMGNPKPVFTFVSEIKDVRQFGKAQDHLEVTLKPNTKAISFFSTPESYKIPLDIGSKVNLHAHLEKSYFRNRPELRLRIVDIIEA